MLNDLGRRINGALTDYLNRSSKFDEKVLDQILKEICSALLESDVRVGLVASLRDRVKEKMIPILSSSQHVQSNQGVTTRERQMLQKVRGRSQLA